MSVAPIETTRLKLIASTLEEVRAQIENMTAAEKAPLSADWLERVRVATTDDPWVLGFDSMGQVVDPEDGLVWRWETAQIDKT